ncbi:hypothetical protein B1R32_1401 [Abditibacterium utsteinense]|uniref:Uncharacterized protein n=1 Tax=Abditibacterium utsteinense TaxID=1960156 RepID=A0A2S8SNM9_9BACT|nr:DUF6572 domain-containing protein [Abditibacterium utsteinense]PQV62398.1 hypothetical protein B1R32_1401 [Abditibacterium utsteinense]
MPLEDTNVIDIVTTSEEGKTVLVLTDAGVTSDPEARNALFMEKLKTYMGAIMSGDLTDQFPAASPRNYEIRVMCTLPPTEEMLAIRSMSPKGDPRNAVPVEFEIFGAGDAAPQKVERALLEAPELSENLASTINFALTMGLEALKDGDEVAHAVVLGPQCATVVLLSGFEDTREAARKYAADLGPEVKAFAVSFEGKMGVGGSLVTAAIVEGSERSLEQGVAFGQRFQPKGFLKKFKLQGERVFLANCDSYFS